jgi:FtsH-binding integral membrane protein
MARLENPSDAGLPVPEVPAWLRIAGTVLRILFILTLLVVTVRVSMPQSETIWSAYETPADLVRMVLGLVVCIWLATQLFKGPEDAQGYRTWLYLGLAAVPFAWICLIYTW